MTPTSIRALATGEGDELGMHAGGVPVAAVFERVGVGVLVLDGAWRVVWASRRAAELLGVEEARLVGTAAAALFGGGAEVVARLAAGVRRGSSAIDPERGRASATGVAPAERDGAGATAVDVSVELAGSGGDDDAAGDGRAVMTVVDASARAAAEAESACLRERLAESERARLKLTSLRQELAEMSAPPVVVGNSEGLRRVRSQVARVAPSDTTVLIQGETGTGKELVARAIHAESQRAGQAFVAVNCAALPEGLIESELFGHERGAFTSADRRRLGKFELADGGTLFLDEIAELPLQAQAKLLRVLQYGTFERVGGAETLHVDVRLVAATHRDLAKRVERGLFREDLFYRLNVFRIEAPPLRDRREDLRPLVEHFHAIAARRMGRPVLPVSDRSMRRIMAYRWPGNIRELANAVERATLLADGPELEVELPDSPAPVMGSGGGEGVSGGGAGGWGGRAAPAMQTRDILLDLTLEQLQRLQIMHALETCGYRVFGPDGAARRLEINPNTLLSRMDKYGIPRPRMARGGRGG